MPRPRTEVKPPDKGSFPLDHDGNRTKDNFVFFFFGVWVGVNSELLLVTYPNDNHSPGRDQGSYSPYKRSELKTLLHLQQQKGENL